MHSSFQPLCSLSTHSSTKFLVGFATFAPSTCPFHEMRLDRHLAGARFHLCVSPILSMTRSSQHCCPERSPTASPSDFGPCSATLTLVSWTCELSEPRRRMPRLGTLVHVSS